jgi:anti-sigma regulatory factor (Ser/Thr protein kinase)
MCWHRSLRASCADAATRNLRSVVRRSLCEPFPTPAAAELLGDIELLTSELTANAVDAHCASVEISLSVHDRWLEVAVHDDALGRPTLRRPVGSATRGRGMMIIEALSAAWGVEEDRGGKTVWSRLALPDALRPGGACTRPGLPA